MAIEWRKQGEHDLYTAGLCGKVIMLAVSQDYYNKRWSYSIHGYPTIIKSLKQWVKKGNAFKAAEREAVRLLRAGLEELQG